MVTSYTGLLRSVQRDDALYFAASRVFVLIGTVIMSMPAVEHSRGVRLLSAVIRGNRRAKVTDAIVALADRDIHTSDNLFL